MASIPIPDKYSKQRYCDLRSPIARYENLREIVDRMPTKVVSATDGVHLDPDLDVLSIKREAAWRPLFRQTHAAQSHLSGNGVAAGDLLITFGWFREVEERRGELRWVPGSPDLHVIFGWMQIGEIINIGERPRDLPDWARYHAHNVDEVYSENNSLYVAADKLSFANVATNGARGAGVFRSYDARRQLTAPSKTRSKWRLPSWFDPRRSDNALTYHPRVSNQGDRPAQWRVFDSQVELDTVGKGQELIFDAGTYPEALTWFTSMLP